MSSQVPDVPADGLVLTAWSDRDVADVLAWSGDEVTRAWSPTQRRVRTPDEALAWIRRRTADDRLDWAVRDATSAALVGRVGLLHIDPQMRGAEIGYGVVPARRRSGVARRSVLAAAQYGFQTLGLARIFLEHAVGNTASCSVAARCGFAYEGVERSAHDHGDGVLHDMHRHARLATDPPGPVDAAPAPPAAIDHVEIAAGRLQLRPPSEAEADDALLMLADPEVARWNPGPDPLDLDTVRRWCARLGDWSDGSHATFSVLDATTARLLGNVSLHRVRTVARTAEVGYRVAPWARGEGVGTDAVTALTRWAFGALDLVRIELAHALENPGSCRVAEKAGYAWEGTLRQSYVYGDGLRYDEHLHARLASD